MLDNTQESSSCAACLRGLGLSDAERFSCFSLFTSQQFRSHSKRNGIPRQRQILNN